MTCSKCEEKDRKIMRLTLAIQYREKYPLPAEIEVWSDDIDKNHKVKVDGKIIAKIDYGI
jgi:hypothetical protein